MRAFVLHAEWEPRSGYQPDVGEVQTRLARQASGVWRNPEVREQAVAEPVPAAGEVVVEVGSCGVCGSDTHCVERDDEGYLLFSGPARLPVVLGHEYTGRVVAKGEGVREARVGQLVAAEGMLYCGVCGACRRGLVNQCVRLRMTGFSAPGAFADRVVVHEKHLWSLDGLAERLGSSRAALDLGALVEPLSCPYNGIWVAAGGMRPGSHVAVHGCGPIGLGAILLCRAAGAASIVAFDVVPERVALAMACGADLAYEVGALGRAGGDPADVILQATRGWGADLQIEAAGAAVATWPTIERAFAPGGTMVYLGRTGERALVGLDALVSGACRVVGSRGHAGGGCFPAVIRLLEAERIDPSAMITARMPLSRTPSALERSRSRTDGKILVQSDPA